MNRTDDDDDDGQFLSVQEKKSADDARLGDEWAAGESNGTICFTRG